ncbi:sensor histidine kinase [Actinospica sp.]|uniref:sensor histidine kinase n=1 Tax=Actinospica sp. TaxID=1872142 RepID=UPI002C175C3F|nr:sensor domain-containing protein [Actinospica sp.]HWG22969.1 sensor domain-containing protein [Actinospica sp.]
MSELGITGRRRPSLKERLLFAPLRGWALIGFGIWNAVLWALVVTSASMVSSMGIGLLLLPSALTLLRDTANAARRLAREWGGIEIEEPYQPVPLDVATAPGLVGMLRRLLARVSDPQTWRDFAWAILDSVVGVAIAAFAASLVLYGVYGFVIGILWPTLTNAGMNDWYGFVHVSKSGALTNLRWATFPLGAAFLVGGAYAGPALIRLHGRWTALLLGPTANARQAALARRVARLTETRADAVDTQAAELRRIERDLHDGAQARLVAMGMNLGAAEALIDQHPEAAKALMAEAREASAKALTELRELVRGIHPPVLSDRGLGDAVRALALDSPLRVEVTVDLPGRLEPAVESAAYFAVSELLTNVAKHAHARTVRIDLWHRDGRLRVTCVDDGRGGAGVQSADGAPGVPVVPGGQVGQVGQRGGGAGRGSGSGLAGIERRIGTFDGVMAVRSPVGGPTEVTLEIPCASSSAKTSTS